jgi:tetratricopeptide (TPR) repeat protein
MTYPQAREAFRHVAATDPECAMAPWGIAMTLFQPLWPTRPGPAILQLGWEAVQKAKALQPRTERERLLVAAAEAFFLEPSSSDYWLRIRRWEQAMGKVYASFPDDPEAAAFYALAHLATAPSDSITRSHSDRAADILLPVYERNPDHPGAMHYLVHANDVPGRERELLEITRKYEAVAPRNPHALHMPTHIYTRLGDWNGVVRGNLRAAEAALEHPAGDHGEFVWDEFPHAIEYLVYAYLQKGADEAAAAQVKRLLATASLEPTFKTAFHLASTQARYALERRAWNEAVVLVPREPAALNWDRFTWPEAIAWFARGLGAAHLGNLSEARAAGERVDKLETATREAGEDLFARNIRVLRLELSAWLAHVEGQRESGVALMREAAELEASTPKHAVTPGPTLPADELLGDLFMEQGRPAEALAAYRRSVGRYPRRFNGLLGAARAAHGIGDESLARAFYQELLDVADGGTRQPALKEAQDYMAQRR